jgi:hypothetical protein
LIRRQAIGEKSESTKLNRNRKIRPLKAFFNNMEEVFYSDLMRVWIEQILGLIADISNIYRVFFKRNQHDEN